MFDTETDRQGDYRVAVLYNVLDDTHEVLRDVDTARNRLETINGLLYCHNTTYDLLVMYGGAILAKFMKGHYRSARHKKCTWLDTLSFFEMPLSETAELTGEAKSGDGGESLDYTIEQLIPYCVQDCKATAALVRMIHTMADKFGLKRHATGPGSWARDYWKQCEPWLEKYPDDLYRGVKHFPTGIVRGGLVKWKAADVGECVKYDIKSAYPWQMVDGTFPELTQIKRGPVGNGLENVLVAWHDEGLERDVWGTEAEAAYYGQPIKDGLWCPAKAIGRPFVKYVETLMEHRNKAKAEGDAGLSYLVKRVLNSLSGALGARTQLTYIRFGVATGGKIAERGLPGTRSIWASLVTGRQRVRILDAWRDCAEPIYSDTDSVICGTFVDDGKGSEALGRWELEDKLSKARIYAKKVYRTTDTGGKSIAHVKGVPKRMALDILQRYDGGGETVAEWDGVASYREAHTAPELWLTRRRDPMKLIRQRELEESQ